jgi:hypothetical protein
VSSNTKNKRKNTFLKKAEKIPLFLGMKKPPERLRPKSGSKSVFTHG